MEKKIIYLTIMDAVDFYGTYLVMKKRVVLKKSCFKKEEANKEFNWTYVRTHETEWCGPYFSRRD